MRRLILIIFGLLLAVGGLGCRSAELKEQLEANAWVNRISTQPYFDNFIAAPGTGDVTPTTDHVRVITVKTDPAFAGLLRAADRTMRSVGGTTGKYSSGQGGRIPRHPKEIIRRVAHLHGANLAVVADQVAGGGSYEGRTTTDYTVTDYSNGVHTSTFHVTGPGQVPFFSYQVHVTLFRGDPTDVAALDAKEAAAEPNNPERTVWGKAFKLADHFDAVFPLEKDPPVSKARGPAASLRRPNDTWICYGQGWYEGILPANYKAALGELGRLYGADVVDVDNMAAKGVLPEGMEPSWQFSLMRRRTTLPPQRRVDLAAVLPQVADQGAVPAGQ